MNPFVRHFNPNVGNALFSGFTLIELMTVLAIVGTLAMLAAPAMSTFIQSNRLATTTNDFVAALNLARSEAVKRGVSTGVCKSNDGLQCTAAGTWSSGWIVFLDPDNNGPWTASDSMVRAYEALPSGTAIAASTGGDSILYNRQGQVPAAPATGFAYIVCNSNTHKSRVVNIVTPGRANISQGAC